MPSSDSELPSLNCISAPNSSSAFVHELRMNVGLVRASLSLYSSLRCRQLIYPRAFHISSSQQRAGRKYGSYMTKHGIVGIDAQGWGTFSCFANNVQVWVELEEDAVSRNGLSHVDWLTESLTSPQTAVA